MTQTKAANEDELVLPAAVRLVCSGLFGVKVIRGKGTSTCVLADFYGADARRNAEAFKLVRETMDMAAVMGHDVESALEWEVGEMFF